MTGAHTNLQEQFAYKSERKINGVASDFAKESDKYDSEKTGLNGVCSIPDINESYVVGKDKCVSSDNLSVASYESHNDVDTLTPELNENVCEKLQTLLSDDAISMASETPPEGSYKVVEELQIGQVRINVKTKVSTRYSNEETVDNNREVKQKDNVEPESDSDNEDNEDYPMYGVGIRFEMLKPQDELIKEAQDAAKIATGISVMTDSAQTNEESDHKAPMSGFDSDTLNQNRSRTTLCLDSDGISPSQTGTKPQTHRVDSGLEEDIVDDALLHAIEADTVADDTNSDVESFGDSGIYETFSPLTSSFHSTSCPELYHLEGNDCRALVTDPELLPFVHRQWDQTGISLEDQELLPFVQRQQEQSGLYHPNHESYVDDYVHECDGLTSAIAEYQTEKAGFQPIDDKCRDMESDVFSQDSGPECFDEPELTDSGVMYMSYEMGLSKPFSPKMETGYVHKHITMTDECRNNAFIKDSMQPKCAKVGTKSDSLDSSGSSTYHGKDIGGLTETDSVVGGNLQGLECLLCGDDILESEGVSKSRNYSIMSECGHVFCLQCREDYILVIPEEGKEQFKCPVC